MSQTKARRIIKKIKPSTVRCGWLFSCCLSDKKRRKISEQKSAIFDFGRQIWAFSTMQSNFYEHICTEQLAQNMQSVADIIVSIDFDFAE